MAKRSLPEWKITEPSDRPELKLYNSFTRQKEVFKPKTGNTVLWYSCGPTVYDSSHMGHARSYITFDILRRVLSGYFGYDVVYVMNITDIDDKIIKRARQNYLYAQYQTKSLEHILTDTKEALQYEINKLRAANNPELDPLIKKLTSEVNDAIVNLEKAVLLNDTEKIESYTKALLKSAKDPLSDFLDYKEGNNITDNSIFSALPRHFENEFSKDMTALNILQPHVLTRVSEYIPEIIAYIEKIIKNGMAYESNGSVYFDVMAFDSCQNHHYAKLVPEAYGDTSILQSGEGELSAKGEKRSATDFALWKASKGGEPWWESPWGKGRPGWHIECSVMASEICGDSLDIHTGGVDLKFPHHDNEIAQAEAYFNNNSWVRYFLHSGHLTIAGCKMSKSLKNFITISDALKKHSARQLRLAFLLHSWKDTLDYSDNTMDMAISYEKTLNEFFLAVKDVMNNSTATAASKWSTKELDLNMKFLQMKRDVHDALCDNIDTRTVLDNFRSLIGICNVYMKDKDRDPIILADIALYMTRMLNLFGVIVEKEAIGFPISSSGDHNVEDTVLPIAQVIGRFRTKVRQEAKVVKAIEILKICDDLRDNVLPELGIRLEDREGEESAVKLIDKEALRREKEAKMLAEETKARKKEELKAQQELREAQRRVKPQEMFLSLTDKYSAFDSNGIPTLDAQGKEISKGQVKKLQKAQAAQKVKYEEYIASLPNS